MEKDVKRRTAQPLLSSTSDDGTRWLYTILHGNGWEIMRNGDRIASGPTGSRSIQAGVDRFLRLTTPRLGAESSLHEQTAMANSA